MHAITRQSHQTGFSYLDVMIAMTILLIGILTLGAALTSALVQTTSGENQLRAKALAATTLENVMAARNVKIGANSYSFESIQNTTAPPGVFLTGRHDIFETPGADGLFGTADDSATGAVQVPGFQREIVIENVDNPRRPSPPNPITERRIVVTVYYGDKGIERLERLSTNVANY